MSHCARIRRILDSILLRRVPESLEARTRPEGKPKEWPYGSAMLGSGHAHSTHSAFTQETCVCAWVLPAGSGRYWQDNRSPSAFLPFQLFNSINSIFSRFPLLNPTSSPPKAILATHQAHSVVLAPGELGEVSCTFLSLFQADARGSVPESCTWMFAFNSVGI